MLAYLLLQVAPSAEGAANSTAGNGGAGFLQLLMFIGMFILFWAILILPESRRRKKLQKEINELKQGDKVMISGGIIGTVEFKGDKTIYLKSLDSKFEVTKESIIAVLQK